MKKVLLKKLSLFVKNIISSRDTTISQLSQSNGTYPIKAIVATITVARKLGSQHILHIKYGQSDNDKAMVPFSISSFFFYFYMSMYLGYFTQLLHCFHVATIIV
jgi:L-rhamnose isomerase